MYEKISEIKFPIPARYQKSLNYETKNSCEHDSMYLLMGGKK